MRFNELINSIKVINVLRSLWVLEDSEICELCRTWRGDRDEEKRRLCPPPQLHHCL